MAVFHGVTGFLPLLLYGLFVYLLAWRLPRWIRSKIADRKAVAKSDEEPDEPDRAEQPPRRRSFAAVVERGRLEPQSSATMVEPSRRTGEEERTTVIETLSVVLRRQVPPDFTRPARSWLGGLPQMPEAVEWPRSVSSESPQQGERPLHFLAQVCCADFPAELWGGLGPRTGWLLLFIDPNQGCPEGPDAFRVLYVEALGPERQPPFDLGPVHDGVYCGPRYDYLLPDDPVPSTWRRWPLDLVTVPNEAREENGRTLVAPENFATLLYGGAAVTRRDTLPPPRPFTFGQAHYALAALRRGLGRSIAPLTLPLPFVETLRQEGMIAALLAWCAAEARTMAERGLDARIDWCARMAEWLREMGTADAIIAYLEQTPDLERAWQDKARDHVDRVIAALRDHEPDTPLTEADWGELVAAFESYDFTRWQYDQLRDVDGEKRLSFREHRRSGALDPPPAMHQLIKDLYLDPARQATLPRAIIDRYEPHWRDLYNNRPHRMGGYHDGLQSDAVIGPAKDLLLFQIASDDAMQWVWGDSGAYYFWIRPDHLQAGDFSGVEMSLECH